MLKDLKSSWATNYVKGVARHCLVTIVTIVMIQDFVVSPCHHLMLKVLQDNHLTATKEEISVMMDIADKNKDG